MNYPKAEKVPIQEIDLPFRCHSKLFIKREELVHPELSGNKYWKLKYNYLQAQKEDKKTLISFGGAYSNHLYALAALGNLVQMKTVGIIRGNELQTKPLNATLAFCKNKGMDLHFVDREKYRLKENSDTIKALIQLYPDSFVIPEGGTNQLAVQGTQEILDLDTEVFTHIACAMGTAGTISGIIEASTKNQKILGVAVLKNAGFLRNSIQKLTTKNNFELFLQNHFGGYGKYNEELLHFTQAFYKNYQIELDLIYTSKLLYALMDLLKNNHFPANSKILAIHSGGLQGNRNLITVKKYNE